MKQVIYRLHLESSLYYVKIQSSNNRLLAGLGFESLLLESLSTVHRQSRHGEASHHDDSAPNEVRRGAAGCGRDSQSLRGKGCPHATIHCLRYRLHLSLSPCVGDGVPHSLFLRCLPKSKVLLSRSSLPLSQLRCRHWSSHRLCRSSNMFPLPKKRGSRPVKTTVRSCTVGYRYPAYVLNDCPVRYPSHEKRSPCALSSWYSTPLPPSSLYNLAVPGREHARQI